MPHLSIKHGHKPVGAFAFIGVVMWTRTIYPWTGKQNSWEETSRRCPTFQSQVFVSREAPSVHFTYDQSLFWTEDGLKWLTDHSTASDITFVPRKFTEEKRKTRRGHRPHKSREPRPSHSSATEHIRVKVKHLSPTKYVKIQINATAEGESSALLSLIREEKAQKVCHSASLQALWQPADVGYRNWT